MGLVKIDIALLKGLILGFSIAAPVGPIGVLCIRRTLAEGRLTGFVSGLGAASADLFYGAVAAFGLTAVSGVLIGQQFWMRLIGGLFLLYLGVRTFRTKPAVEAARAESGDLATAYFSTLFLTLTNPMTILSFAAVFSGMGVAQSAGDYASAGLLVTGVFLGSAAWWLTLSTGVGLLRERFTPGLMLWVNRISGSAIVIFGLVALAGLISN